MATPEGDEHGHSSDDSVSRTDPDDRNDQQFTIPQTTKSQRWTRDEIVALANHVATLSDTNPSRIDWIRCQTVVSPSTFESFLYGFIYLFCKSDPSPHRRRHIVFLPQESHQ